MIVDVPWGNPNSLERFLSQTASRPASESATYSASVVDSAIMDCFLDFQVITPPAAKKTYPIVDFISQLFAYAVSAKPWKRVSFSHLSLGLRYVIPRVLVPARYLSIRFNAV